MGLVSEQTPEDRAAAAQKRLAEALEAIRAEPKHTLDEVCDRLGLDPEAVRRRAREKQLETVLNELMDERADLFDRLANE